MNEATGSEDEMFKAENGIKTKHLLAGFVKGLYRELAVRHYKEKKN